MPGAPPPAICAPGAFATYDGVSELWSPCVTRRGSFIAESTYLQNASAVGGTNYAAYPMLELRTGVLPRLEFAFHTPSQVAESGRNGTGLYPATRLGYGLRYAAFAAPRLAVALATDILPPMSRFSPNHVQSRYVLGVSSAYRLTRRLTLGLSASGTSSAKVGFSRLLPAQALQASYEIGRRTQLSVDLGNRQPAAKAFQAFGDIALDQAFSRRVALKIGAGTAFNTAMGSKAHYLASGIDYRM